MVIFYNKGYYEAMIPSWIFIILVIASLISLIALFAIQKNVSHVVKSHIRVIGADNARFIQTKELFAIRAAYLISIITATIGSFIVSQIYFL